MQYLGSKNKIAKYLKPIIESYINENTNGYIEPFVGGANMIDKIKCGNKIGYDIHYELIELLNYVKFNADKLPHSITIEEYNKVKMNKDDYPSWYVGLVGFCGSYGAKWFGGYAKGNDKRDRQNEAIRNIKKQQPELMDIKFECKDFKEIKNIENYVIYCDIPYKGTTKYETEEFPYDEFYDWCREMSKNNVVLISEYSMPDDFECIWEMEYKVNFDSGRIPNDYKNKRVEKLFKFK